VKIVKIYDVGLIAKQGASYVVYSDAINGAKFYEGKYNTLPFARLKIKEIERRIIL